MVSLYQVKMNIPLLKTNKESDYVRWWPQMDAYGVYKEFSEVMKTTKYANLPDQEKQFESDGVTEVDLKHTDTEKEALIKNRMAMTAFTMAFWNNEDQYCMNMVLDSKTTRWPSRQAWAIIQDLQEEYAPTSLMGDIEQQSELEAIQRKRNTNPKELFSQITAAIVLQQ